MFLVLIIGVLKMSDNKCVLDYMDLSGIYNDKIDISDIDFRDSMNAFAKPNSTPDDVFRIVEKVQNCTSGDIAQIAMIIESVSNDFDYIIHLDSYFGERITALIDSVVVLSVKRYSEVLFGEIDFVNDDSELAYTASEFNEKMESLIQCNGEYLYWDDGEDLTEDESLRKVKSEARQLLSNLFKTRN